MKISAIFATARNSGARRAGNTIRRANRSVILIIARVFATGNRSISDAAISRTASRGITKGLADRRPRLCPMPRLTNYIPNPGRGHVAEEMACASKGRAIPYPIMCGRLAAGPQMRSATGSALSDLFGIMPRLITIYPRTTPIVSDITGFFASSALPPLPSTRLIGGSGVSCCETNRNHYIHDIYVIERAEGT